jgi:SAM-dependent methyltransferase
VSPSEPEKLFGETGGQHAMARFVDHTETYGPHVVADFIGGLSGIGTAVDIGAGSGRDLEIVHRAHPRAKRTAVEGGREYAAALESKVDEVHVLDIERARQPFADESIDLFIANQVLEHTKEVFWIFHEVTRCLKVGGHFLIGVPNVASFHNRLLLLLGVQPTQHKLCSAHVRPFSKHDTLKFLEACFPGGYRLRRFAGSQFYPFPAPMARVMSRAFPAAAFSIFFLLQKSRPYTDGFARYPSDAHLETNFWNGSLGKPSQYDPGE